MNTATAVKLEPAQTSKVCKCCKKEKPITEFYRNRLGYTDVCIDCANEHRKAKKEKKKEEEMLRLQLDDKRKLALSEFTPRELMVELKRRGYEFTMTYTEVHTISSDKL